MEINLIAHDKDTTKMYKKSSVIDSERERERWCETETDTDRKEKR